MVVVRTMLLTLLRGRLYIGMVTAGVMLVVVAFLLQELSVGEGQRAFVAIGLAAHALVTDVTAVAAAFTLAQAYLIGRGAIPLMARPVSRFWFVVAAVVALSVATMVNGALLGAMLASTRHPPGMSPWPPPWAPARRSCWGPWHWRFACDLQRFFRSPR